MKIEMISVADFYNNPDEVREFALNQEFSQVGNFPGTRTQPFLNDSVKEILQQIVEPSSGKITWWGDVQSGAFQSTLAIDRSWMHVDSTTTWAGIVYLTPDAPVSAGTGIFKFKENDLRTWDYTEHTDEENKISPHHTYSQDYTKWEMVDRIGNLYNRLILYRGNLFHTSLDYFGNRLDNGRLFQTFFFNTEK
tara:strand:- start:881 stop:1459 length:579 start_codon:yes stop_codon:yes gene_type:complete